MATASTHTYNAAKNRLLAADNLSFTYDNEGQLATGYGVSYAFDYEHRLTAIGADASNTITRYYIHGIGLVATVTPAGATYCYHYNQIGSTVALTDMNQAVVNQYAYTPFGEIANQAETIAQPFTFVGQMGVMAEPNGFYYMRARYYDPEVRRFISEDPIGFDGGDLNLYAHVGNNPIIFTDPSGLWKTEDHPPQFRAEDTNWETSPFNILGGGLSRHFRSREEVMPEIYEAILRGDKNMFESRMHQMQDTYSHYDAGYRTYTLGHAFASLLGEDPDDKDVNYIQFQLTQDNTARMRDLWNMANPAKRY